QRCRCARGVRIHQRDTRLRSFFIDEYSGGSNRVRGTDRCLPDKDAGAVSESEESRTNGYSITGIGGKYRVAGLDSGLRAGTQTEASDNQDQSQVSESRSHKDAIEPQKMPRLNIGLTLRRGEDFELPRPFTPAGGERTALLKFRTHDLTIATVLVMVSSQTPA